MKTVRRQHDNKAAFTIVELLTVMSIIVILISLLVPALSRVRRYSRRVKQKAQFHAIEVALDIYSAEQGEYPDSGQFDENDESYCGAMRLCEAMVGQDMLGSHPDSHFTSNLKVDPTATNPLYEDPVNYTGFIADATNLGARKGPYLQLENANANRLGDLYGTAPGNTGSLEKERFVLCDVYGRVTDKQSGKSLGMPILYYKADTSKIKHDIANPLSITNIYKVMDNDDLVMLGMPWDGGVNGSAHYMASDKTWETIHEKTGGGYELADPNRFYANTINEKINVTGGRPYRMDSYILLSAGFDGEYGTGDDVFNFGN